SPASVPRSAPGLAASLCDARSKGRSSRAARSASVRGGGVQGGGGSAAPPGGPGGGARSGGLVRGSASRSPTRAGGWPLFLLDTTALRRHKPALHLKNRTGLGGVHSVRRGSP